jgi:hypothetical protein
MSFAQFAYAAKGIANETGMPYDEVARRLAEARPTAGPASPATPHSSPQGLYRKYHPAVGEPPLSLLPMGNRSPILRQTGPVRAAASSSLLPSPRSDQPRAPAAMEWTACDAADERRFARIANLPGMTRTHMLSASPRQRTNLLLSSDESFPGTTPCLALSSTRGLSPSPLPASLLTPSTRTPQLSIGIAASPSPPLGLCLDRTACVGVDLA